MQHWYVKFTNGYTQQDFTTAKSVITNINFYTGYKVAEKIRAKVDDMLYDTVYSETLDNALEVMDKLVTYLDGIMDILEDGELLRRVVGYLYDALSLAVIVPYADRLN